MIVTVQETIEHSADITAEMVEAYMRRHKWRHGFADDGLTPLWIRGKKAVFRPTPFGNVTTKLVIEDMAKQLGRKPHEVLADIAEGR